MVRPAGTGCYACNGSGVVDDREGERPRLACYGAPVCRLGYIEPDGFRHCGEHGGFANRYGPTPSRCDSAPGVPREGGA